MPGGILITVGSGFIGSYVADGLLREGYEGRVLDNLNPQVHGPQVKRPDYLNPEVEFIKGDIRSRDMISRALSGAVGVGQSMNIERLAARAFNMGGGTSNTISLIELIRRIEELHQ